MHWSGIRFADGSVDIERVLQRSGATRPTSP
jgi:hypothetical protein